MNSQHLSDEAVAAFADGVLTGHARERATRHIGACGECAHAVRVQREAAWSLRAAPVPALPLGLADRLRTLPQTTQVALPPTVVAPDGTTMLSTFAPMAALVPPRRSRTEQPAGSRTEQPAGSATEASKRSAHRVNPIVTTLALVAITGALTAGTVAHHSDGRSGEPGTSQVVRQFSPDVGRSAPVIAPVSLFRAAGR